MRTQHTEMERLSIGYFRFNLDANSDKRYVDSTYSDGQSIQMIN